MPVIPVLGRLREEYREFEVSLGSYSKTLSQKRRKSLKPQLVLLKTKKIGLWYN
jgi:hypothetical protein